MMLIYMKINVVFFSEMILAVTAWQIYQMTVLPNQFLRSALKMTLIYTRSPVQNLLFEVPRVYILSTIAQGKMIRLKICYIELNI